MTIKNRIRQQLLKLDLSPRTASLAAGFNTHFLHKHLNSEQKSFRIEDLIALAEALQTSPEWLIFGRGPEDFPPGASELLDAYTRLSAADRKSALDYIHWLENKNPGK